MLRWAIGLGAIAALALLAARVGRVEVAGDSMRPTLLAGDRLLVWRTRRVRPGWVVVVAAPDGRPLVKRVTRAEARRVEVRGDNPLASTDSRVLGTLPRELVQGRAFYRYHPPERAGWCRAGPVRPAAGQAWAAPSAKSSSPSTAPSAMKSSTIW